MTDTRARFGELVTAARRHLRAAASNTATITPGRDAAELGQELSHLATVLARFTGDATRIVSQLPDGRIADIDCWDRAALEAHDALRAAVRQFAGSESDRDGESGLNPSAPRAQNVAAAARALAAGRDLLHSHSTTDAGGVWHPRSPWTAPLVTPQATRVGCNQKRAGRVRVDAAWTVGRSA